MHIDIHAHITAPAELYAYKANLLAQRGAHGSRLPKISDELHKAALNAPLPNFGKLSHLEHVERAGIDRQVISARPFHMMHSEEPFGVVERFTHATNDAIAQQCALYPDLFSGMGAMPQSPVVEPSQWLDELERCVNELGFVGCLLNPDPWEGANPRPPGLGDKYWYPVYEKVCELDVPVLIHSAGCRAEREPYSLHFIQEETVGLIHMLRSSVIEDFPDLKVIFSHGGGAVPYQMGRFEAAWNRLTGEPFIDRVRRLYYDTCLYGRAPMELLIQTVGADRVLLGTEKPGTGSIPGPDGGWLDDTHRVVESIPWLDDEAKRMIMSGTAQRLFKL